jgi:hypothetical protein
MRVRTEKEVPMNMIKKPDSAIMTFQECNKALSQLPRRMLRGYYMKYHYELLWLKEEGFI